MNDKPNMMFHLEVLSRALEFLQAHTTPDDDPFAESECAIAFRESWESLEALRESVALAPQKVTKNAA